MPKLVADITMSLDGFVAGPNDDADRPLHSWVRAATGVDREVLDDMVDGYGALLLGRRAYDRISGDDLPYRVPCFVLTHRGQTRRQQGRATFSFVTEGIDEALEQACAAAGDRDVGIVGGASIIQQYLSAGLVDEIRIHLAPVLLGTGTRLFDQIDKPVQLERTGGIDSPHATHLQFRIG